MRGKRTFHHNSKIMICQNRHLYVHDANGTQCITAAADRIASVQEESVAGGEHLIKDAAGRPALSCRPSFPLRGKHPPTHPPLTLPSMYSFRRSWQLSTLHTNNALQSKKLDKQVYLLLTGSRRVQKLVWGWGGSDMAAPTPSQKSCAAKVLDWARWICELLKTFEASCWT